jgi:hypothetical protein
MGLINPFHSQRWFVMLRRFVVLFLLGPLLVLMPAGCKKEGDPSLKGQSDTKVAPASGGGAKPRAVPQ